MGSQLLVSVIEVNSQQVLFSCSLEEKEKAYAFAKSLEDELEVEVREPSIMDSLSHALGLSVADNEKLLNSAQDEIEHHD
jgi:hypothetical protein